MLLKYLFLTFIFICVKSNEINIIDQIYKLHHPYYEDEINPTITSDELYFEQQLDHFNASDNRTWSQRYFLSNNSYVAGGPVFLYLAGEWEANPSEVTDRFIGILAERYGAFMIDLEHRYYGKSHPTPDITTENLKYLNADQAIEDAAAFTLFMKNNLNLTGPWIVCGGSYSAQLSAWSRAKYPNLYYAALSSSAPVYAQLDIPEYMEVVDDALRATSPICPEIITAAMNELQVLVDEQNTGNITELFNLCREIDLSIPESMMAVYLYTSLYYGFKVQYARNGSLDEICNTLIEGQDTPLETLSKMVTDNYAPSCLVTDPDIILGFFRNDTDWSNRELRAFYYQMCVEYGHYMSLSSPNQPFGQNLPVEYFLLWCPDVYGPEFDRELNEIGINRTNTIFGGYNPNVTKVIYTHGSLDPWHPFGILQDLNSETPAIVIQGESHCRDLSKPEDYDSNELIAARIEITNIFDLWLSGFYTKK